MTEWHDRQVSAGVGATINFRDGADRAVISVDEERVSRACLPLFYGCCFFSHSSEESVSTDRISQLGLLFPTGSGLVPTSRPSGRSA